MTAGTWLDHKQLMIIKGIGKTPGDLYSAENDPVIVNLMGGVITLNDWSPEIAQVKSGGIWADSPLSDGRELLAASAGNVIEKISVIISDNSYLGAMKALSGLNQMANDCRDYWLTEYQVDPVYLAWWAGCGVGLQYALLSNIEVSPDYIDSPMPTIRASITLEREPYWRGIPPGANPRIWSYYVNTTHPQFNVNVASLISGSNDLIIEAILNKFEWTPTAYGLQLIPLNISAGVTPVYSKNYIEIPAASIPGDAPALVQITSSGLGSSPVQTYIGVTSKKYSGVGHDGINRGYALNLNAGDGNSAGAVTKTAATIDTGVRSNGSSVTFYRGVRTVTGVDGAYVTACQWGIPLTANSIQLDREFYRGTFAVFVRAYNESAAAPVLSDMKMRVVFEELDGFTSMPTHSQTLQEVNPPLRTAGTGTDYELSYMGTISLPFTGRSVVSSLGYGRQLKQSLSNMRITVQQQVLVATANRTFNIIDLIMMPIDEGMVSIVTPAIAASSDAIYTILDNTGYLLRGDSNQVAFLYNATNLETGGIEQETRGQTIYLKPKTNQRIYIIGSSIAYPAPPTNALSSQIAVNINIVPRWAGIRDV